MGHFRLKRKGIQTHATKSMKLEDIKLSEQVRQKKTVLNNSSSVTPIEATFRDK